MNKFTKSLLPKSWRDKLYPPDDEPDVIVLEADDPDPSKLNVHTAYKTRWIWYHTILAIEIFLTNVLLIAILVVLSIKL